MADTEIMQRHCMGDDCQFKEDKDGRDQLSCVLCCIRHHAECVSVPKKKTAQIWTCFECRQLVPCVKNLQEEIKHLKDNQTKMLDMLQKITKSFESSEANRIKAEQDLAHVKTQLSDMSKQLTNERPCTTEQATPTAPLPQATPSAPPLPNLMIGTSLLRNVDQTKLNNWEVKAKGGATIEGVLKELNDIDDSKTYNEIILVCGSIDLENKAVDGIILDFQTLTVSASQICSKVSLSSILPRTDKNCTEKMKQVNEKLKVLCDRDGHNFIDNDQTFLLMNGDANEAMLTNDGLHLSKRGVDRLLINCGVLKEGSAFTSAKYPDPERSSKLLFKGHKNPLSNFHPVDMRSQGKQFKSSEAAYQYIKAETMGDHNAARKILQAETGLQAMKIAAKIQTNEQWQHKKFSVMEKVIGDKLRVCEAAQKSLLESKSKTIVEDTAHEFWGRGQTGQGKNMLGKIWMDYRHKLQNDRNFLKRQANDRERQTNYRERPATSYQQDRQWATRSSQPRCYRCGEPSHTVRQCRKADVVTCWACGRAGHKQKHCDDFSRQQRTTRGAY